MSSFKLNLFILAIAVIGLSSGTLAAPTPQEDTTLSPNCDSVNLGDRSIDGKRSSHIENCWL
ncbi:hypothetical protein BC628DRAFT_1422402 [Trametes gibbosa]|nr:hypothetical protein BC628DRAFT_1422402 [Trametes gibbosa]